MLAQKPPQTSQHTSTALPEVAPPITKVQHYWNIFSYYFMLLWENGVIIILGLQSFHGLFTAIKFIIDDYPRLVTDFEQHSINTIQITSLLTDSIGLMLATMINILFAIRLSKAQERVSRILELIIGTALIIWYSQVLAFLQSIDYTSIGKSLTFLGL